MLYSPNGPIVAFFGPIVVLLTPLYVKFLVVMQGNTATKRQKYGNGSSVPIKKINEFGHSIGCRPIVVFLNLAYSVGCRPIGGILQKCHYRSIVAIK